MPSFDILRVEPSGDAVIAGVAEPGAVVEVLDAGKPVATAKADDSGDWALALDRPLAPGTHDLSIRTTAADHSNVTLSDQRVAVSVPEKPMEEPLVVLNSPDAASRIIEMPKSPPAGVAKVGEPGKKPTAPVVAEAAPLATPNKLSVAGAAAATAGQKPDKLAEALPPGAAGTADTGKSGQPAAASASVIATLPSKEQGSKPLAGKPAEGKSPGAPLAPVVSDGKPARPQVASAEPAMGDGGNASSKAAAAVSPAVVAEAAGTPAAVNPPVKKEPALGKGAAPPAAASAEPAANGGGSASSKAAAAVSPAVVAEAAGTPAAVNPPTKKEPVPGKGVAPPVAASAEPTTNGGGNASSKAGAAASPAVVAAAGAAPAPANPAATAAKAATPPIIPKVVVTAVEADTAGSLYVAGTATTREPIRVYLDDAILGETKPTEGGTWLIEVHRELAAGTYRIRADQIDPASGQVMVGAEVPFQRDIEVAALKMVGEAGGPGGASASGAMPDPQTVIVKRYDNLWQISRKMYGNGTRWSTIYVANKEQIHKPRMIFPGQVFTVPVGDMSWKD
jgi:nucleoid-associated protein YgaU